MIGLCVHPIRGALACLSVLAFLSVGGALAQPGPPARGTSAAPATLRLVQVVPRLPDLIHLYAIVQDEGGTPVDPQPGELSALAGSNTVSVEIGQDDGVAIVFLVDISLSLRLPQFELIKLSLLAWIDSLGPADRAAVVTFGSSVNTVQDFTADKLDKRALTLAVTKLAPRDQRTLLYQGMVQAIDLSRRLDGKLPLRRAIVVLTDGLDDQQGGAGRLEVFDKLAVDPTPIYGIGASSINNTAVDEALKNFAGLTRKSGGDFRRVDVKSLDKSYIELRKIVAATKHLTAKCPACTADGSTLVFRLLMSRGTTRLDSESVTARLVGTDGKISPKALPPPIVAEPPVVVPVIPNPQPPLIVKPPEIRWWDKFPISKLFKLPLQWLILLALAVCGAIVGIVVALQRHRIKPPPTPPPTREASIVIASSSSGAAISIPSAIPPGTQQDKRRLRLYPLGHNDLNPIDVVFEQDLAVGRSPDSDICINNDGQVSAIHCTLSPKGGSILVQDTGSRNGTRVNGIPIKDFLHAEPDSILGVGRTELRMKFLPVGVR